MMIISRLALCALLLPGAAHAALSGEYQRAAELTQIIASNAVLYALQNQPINSITMTDTDVFAVASDDCTVIVTLFDLPPPDGGWPPGPRQFDLSVGDAVCR
jgi:hypothetical protein